MSAIRHPCVLSAEKVMDSEYFYCIEMERMDLDLNQYIKTNHLDKDVNLSIFVQICLGLRYLHNMNIIHRDIKAENILIKTRFTIPLIRIGDFGISMVLKDN